MFDTDTWGTIRVIIGFLLLITGGILIAFGIKNLETDNLWLSGIVCIVIGLVCWMINLSSEHEDDGLEWRL